MLTISKLNLHVERFYRCNPPTGVFHLTFKLDPESEYYLVEEARKLNSDSEVQKLEKGIVDAATRAVMALPEKELKHGEINESLKLQIDREFTGRLFAFQFKQDGAKNNLVVTKAKVIGDSDNVYEGVMYPDEPLVSAMNFGLQEVSTNVWVAPITVDYMLDEDTAYHLEEVASGLSSKDDVKELGNRIRRVVRLAAHRMVKNGKIYRPHGTKIKWRYYDKEKRWEFKMLFTIINGRRFLVRKIRIGT